MDQTRASSDNQYEIAKQELVSNMVLEGYNEQLIANVLATIKKHLRRAANISGTTVRAKL